MQEDCSSKIEMIVKDLDDDYPYIGSVIFHTSFLVRAALLNKTYRDALPLASKQGDNDEIYNFPV